MPERMVLNWNQKTFAGLECLETRRLLSGGYAGHDGPALQDDGGAVVMNAAPTVVSVSNQQSADTSDEHANDSATETDTHDEDAPRLRGNWGLRGAQPPVEVIQTSTGDEGTTPPDGGGRDDNAAPPIITTPRRRIGPPVFTPPPMIVTPPPVDVAPPPVTIVNPPPVSVTPPPATPPPVIAPPPVNPPRTNPPPVAGNTPSSADHSETPPVQSDSSAGDSNPSVPVTPMPHDESSAPAPDAAAATASASIAPSAQTPSATATAAQPAPSAAFSSIPIHVAPSHVHATDTAAEERAASENALQRVMALVFGTNPYGRVRGAVAPDALSVQIGSDPVQVHTLAEVLDHAGDAQLSAGTLPSDSAPAPAEDPAADLVLPPQMQASFRASVDRNGAINPHNIMAAILAAVSLAGIQLHRWRKRRLEAATAAAQKLSSLLTFDPLAVWVDHPRRRR